MFDIFGEFNSAEEVNEAAAAQLQEGDTDAVMTIARENGIDADDAQDYIDGMVDKLCSPLMAAFGKIEVETLSLHCLRLKLDVPNVELQASSFTT